MTGITFYLQIFFALLLLWATAMAIFMGVLHAHREGSGAGRRHLCLIASSLLSLIVCFFLYSWTFLSW